MASKRKESRKDKRIKRLEAMLEEEEDRSNGYWEQFIEERRARSKLLQSLKEEGYAEKGEVKKMAAMLDDRDSRINQLNSELSRIAAVVGEQDTDDMVETIERLFDDTAHLLTLVQCPNAPCTCGRSILAARLAARYFKHTTSFARYAGERYPPPRWLGGAEDETGCDSG